MNLFLMPMWFLSGALFPAAGAAGVIRWVMRCNPLTYGLDGLRRCLYHADPAVAGREPAMWVCLMGQPGRGRRPVRAGRCRRGPPHRVRPAVIASRESTMQTDLEPSPTVPYDRPVDPPGRPTRRPSLRMVLIGMWAVAGLTAAAGGAAVWLLHDHAADAAAAVRFTPEEPAADAPLPVLFEHGRRST